ncbi:MULTISPECIES: hypothetical protein [Rhizobium/Agrobacterium group]|nr:MULTISPECIES: hypothetical protein [Rhizobium/Agrobacterium group]MDA5633686.1 hypothetical protein [Agrobacterium sp. ST15.16.024]MDF1889332.1 hypothetical protein [Rhizobium rhizogenes]
MENQTDWNSIGGEELLAQFLLSHAGAVADWSSPANKSIVIVQIALFKA